MLILDNNKSESYPNPTMDLAVQCQRFLIAHLFSLPSISVSFYKNTTFHSPTHHHLYLTLPCNLSQFLSFPSFTNKFLHTSFDDDEDDDNNTEKEKEKKMKLVWCPDTAAKAYLDTIQSVKHNSNSSTIIDTGVAELVSAMAGGWKPQLIVETWTYGGPITTSMGLASASRHTCGRHVCIVPDERSRTEYTTTMQKSGLSPEVVMGNVEEIMSGLVGVDFLVVDGRRKDFIRMLSVAKLSHRGAVLVCKNASARNGLGFRWRSVLDYNSRVVRCAYLPVGSGLDIAYVATNTLGSGGGNKGKSSRWFRHIDQSGEEHVFRR